MKLKELVNAAVSESKARYDYELSQSENGQETPGLQQAEYDLKLALYAREEFWALMGEEGLDQ